MPTASSRADERPLDKPRVLVVDDDRAVRDSLRRSLEFNGYAVALATDGAEALAGIASARPDVVVMDVMMPRLDGLETTRALRALASVDTADSVRCCCCANTLSLRHGHRR